MAAPLERAIAAVNNTSRVQDIAGDQVGVLGAEPLHVVVNPEEVARAVLQAIREPSEGMIEAGLDLGPDHDPERYFTAMIDAALEEG